MPGRSHDWQRLVASLHKVQCAPCRHHRDAGHGQGPLHHCPATAAAQHRGCTPQASQNRALPQQLTWKVNAPALYETEGSRLLLQIHGQGCNAITHSPEKRLQHWGIWTISQHSTA